MYNLLIVDDEPLVQVGIKSMLNWQEYDIEVVGTAANGKQAIEFMKNERPNIVITDIKMPIMDGLALVKYCKDNFNDSPIFIILTSFEEFELAKQAIKYNVSDYLIKLELTAETLQNSIKNAVQKLESKESRKEKNTYNNAVLKNSYEEKYFIKLLYNLFENEEMIYRENKTLKLGLAHKKFIVGFGEIYCDIDEDINDKNIINKYNCTMNMFSNIFKKYMDNIVVSLDFNHFAMICYEDGEKEISIDFIQQALSDCREMINNYFNVNVVMGLGKSCHNLKDIPRSFYEAKQAFNLDQDHQNIKIYYDNEEIGKNLSLFNDNLLKQDLTTAFEQYDINGIYKIFTKVINCLENYNYDYLYALDCAGNMLYLSINLLPESREVINKIFKDEKHGYRSLYEKKSVNEIIKWLQILRDNLCQYIEAKKKNYKHHIVTQVKRYINENIEEKLYLNEIADLHNISPSYLSSIFKKDCRVGFSEYITSMKISKAKELLLEENHKVYEVSDMLGFESAFYFSKVFKKVTGYSPKEYVQRNG